MHLFLLLILYCYHVPVDVSVRSRCVQKIQECRDTCPQIWGLYDLIIRLALQNVKKFIKPPFGDFHRL